jgi:hypothetical protein
VFDRSRPFPAGSKWRQKLSPAEKARVAATDARLRIETQALNAGIALPVRPRRSRAKPKPAGDAEMTTLRDFIVQHGRDIAPMLARSHDETQWLAVARAYRDVLNGVVGAHERWNRILIELGM